MDITLVFEIRESSLSFDRATNFKTIYMLFLDDIRIPYDVYGYTNQIIYCRPWDIVRDYDSFINFIETNGVPEVISFDHDLGDTHYNYQNQDIPYDDFNEKTGYHCAKWLIDYCIDNKIELPKRIYIHSMNIVGSRNIKSLFDTYVKVYNDDAVIKNVVF